MNYFKSGVDPKDPKKGVNDKPAEEQQFDKKNKPLKPEVEQEEEELDLELDDAEFDEYDEDGGDEDFKDSAEKKETVEDQDAIENLDGIEGTNTHITNSEEEIVNKKGQ
jgi:hypothetical protein